jgi:hypothetical protein
MSVRIPPWQDSSCAYSGSKVLVEMSSGATTRGGDAGGFRVQAPGGSNLRRRAPEFAGALIPAARRKGH